MKVYHFLIILFRIMKNFRKYIKVNYIVDLRDMDYIDDIINLYYGTYIVNWYMYMDTGLLFIIKLQKSKSMFIENDYVKQYLTGLIDRIYNDNLLFKNSEMDKLNYIITREIMKIK